MQIEWNERVAALLDLPIRRDLLRGMRSCGCASGRELCGWRRGQRAMWLPGAERAFVDDHVGIADLRAAGADSPDLPPSSISPAS